MKLRYTLAEMDKLITDATTHPDPIERRIAELKIIALNTTTALRQMQKQDEDESVKGFFGQSKAVT